MHSPACSIHVPMAKRAQPDRTYRFPVEPVVRLATQPQLNWVARIKGVDPVGRIDVMGTSAFRLAGLYAYARPSPKVALFVFDPNPAKDGWRFESWLCEPDAATPQLHRLRKAIVASRNMGAPGDAVDAMRQCEAETTAAVKGWLGGLL